MLRYEWADAAQADTLTTLRLEVLRDVNHLPPDAAFASDTIRAIDAYWHTGDYSMVLVWDGAEVIACATLCYLLVMPTTSHPTGKRAHLMNVYTRAAYRRQGIAAQMLRMLLEEAKRRGVTEISLDATEAGRPLYEHMGFQSSTECMVLAL